VTCPDDIVGKSKVRITSRSTPREGNGQPRVQWLLR
jgi:hypothetical protein